MPSWCPCSLAHGFRSLVEGRTSAFSMRARSRIAGSLQRRPLGPATGWPYFPGPSERYAKNSNRLHETKPQTWVETRSSGLAPQRMAGSRSTSIVARIPDLRAWRAAQGSGPAATRQRVVGDLWYRPRGARGRPRVHGQRCLVKLGARASQVVKSHMRTGIFCLQQVSREHRPGP